MKPGIDDICFTLHQILVGAASSREKKAIYSPYLHNRGWKPLPQSKSFKLTNLNFLGSNEVSFLIRLAVFWASGGACMKLHLSFPLIFHSETNRSVDI